MRAKRLILTLILIFIAGLATSCPHRAEVNSDIAFVERSYWIDNMSTRLNLTFYSVGSPFSKTLDDIEKCTIGTEEDITYECKVIKIDAADDPIYELDGIRYYQGRLSIETSGVKSSIGTAFVTLMTKDGGKQSFRIGNVAYTTVDDEANQMAEKAVEYASINPALYSEYDRPKVAAFAVELNALKPITITRFASASDVFGFDIEGSIVCTYDEYMSKYADALDSMELDSLIPGIYERRSVARHEVAGRIELKAGRYVLIVPLVQYENDIPEPVFAGLDVFFDDEMNNYHMHLYCNPIIVENFHVQDEVRSLF